MFHCSATDIVENQGKMTDEAFDLYNEVFIVVVDWTWICLGAITFYVINVVGFASFGVISKESPGWIYARYNKFI